MFEIGKIYRDGWGAIHHIMGYAQVNNSLEPRGIVWTLRGFWFRQRDGRKITVTRQQPLLHPINQPSKWDLCEEVTCEAFQHSH